MARARKPYSGVLLEPRPATVSFEEWFDALMIRLDALSKHYGHDWRANTFGLLLALAHDAVPGFKVMKKPGRPATNAGNDIMILGELFQAEEEGRSVNAAAMRFARRHGQNAATVRQRYISLMKGGPEARRAFRLLAQINKL